MTNSATVYIESAATEGGTANHALWVDSGSTRLDGTLTVGSTAADAIDVAGGINTGSGNVALVNAAGKITALSSTEVADLSGAALTTLNASNISSGTLANARLPTNVDLGGTLDVTGATVCDSTLTVVNDVAVDTDTLFVDASEDFVGVGTASPQTDLHIDNPNAPGVLISRINTGGAFGDGSDLGYLRWGGQDSDSNLEPNAANITAQVAGTWTSSSHPTELKFSTVAASSVDTTLALTLTSAQNATFAGSIGMNGETAAANQLDDYEEGTWSPIPRGSTGSAGTAAHNMNGNYTKIGRLVVATCYGYFTNLGSWTGSFEVAGWPFTHGAGQVTQGSIGQFPFGTDGTGAGSWRTVMFPAGGTHCNFREGYNMDTVTPFSQIHGTGFAVSLTISYYA